MNQRNYPLILSSVIAISFLAWISDAKPFSQAGKFPFAAWRKFLPADTVLPDSVKNRPYIKSTRPTYKPKDRVGDPLSNQAPPSPLLLGTPSNVKMEVELDDSLKQFGISERVGELDFRNPTTMSFEEYSRYQQQQAIRNYWRAKSEGGVAGESATGAAATRLIPKLSVMSPVFDRIFGGNAVDIQTNGNIGLKFGARFNRNFNPSLPVRQQRIGDFDFDQNMALNVVGNIGEKMKLNFNWDTKANFEFENNIKLDYTGYEEEIIRKIEAGNVSLPLNNSLITGGQNLFGVKAQLQFGRLAVTTIASNVRGRTDEINIENGSQSRDFEIKASQYERDRHFFLSHYFRDRYDRALRDLPLLTSGISIRRLEVYITNDNRATENLRNMVALMDLGETNQEQIYRDERVYNPANQNKPTANNNNNLYALLTGAGATVRRQNDQVDDDLQRLGFQKTIDFEHVRARRLDPQEYKFNPQLGYITLNTTLLPEQTLGVAFEYTFNGKNYQVGELQEDYQNVGENQVIYMKMLRSTNPAPLELPVWDLMMKNVYSLNASQITRQNFQLRVIYKDDETGVDIPSIKEGERIKDIPLVEVFNLDNVNTNNDRPRDGNFDFLENITIDPEMGRIFFPVVEPFGSFLNSKFTETEQPLREKYVYQELYELTQSDAQQFTSKDKFFIKGRYQASSTNEIALPGIQIAEGSVTVYSGGTRLTEGVDYQVDYNLARVKILNQSYMSSASNLKVNFERAEIINPQPRAMVGARFDYRINNDINLGGTLLHLGETPYNNNRVSLGEEPSNNTIYGLDINLRRDSRMLTKLTDMLPLIQTKEPSTITFNAEFAQLLPAKAKMQGENGVSYIDDFEGTESAFGLAGSFNSNNWRLAATPSPLIQGRTGLAYADNRAKIAWYTIDQGIYYRNGGRRPNNITAGDLKNHYTRGISRQEIFPYRDPEAQNNYEYPFDIAYYPKERGQYNYSPNITPDGKFLTGDPRNNYGGISREITFDNDFDNANIEYMEFWLLDPFINSPRGHIMDNEGNDQPNRTGGELVLNLGNISEDLMKDQNRYAFENGLPTAPFVGTVRTGDPKPDTDRTPWGFVTRLPFLTDAFDSNAGSRQFQDIGLDGLNNSEEKEFFQGVYSQLEDPSNDDFRHHLSTVYDNNDTKILGRYKHFNGMEGNSPTESQESSYVYPDKEDLNKDNVVSDVERYYEYRIPLKPAGTSNGLQVGQNYIVDKVETTRDGDKVTWYQFRIPVRQPSGAVNGMNGFKSIRFMRLYLTQFAEPVVLRFVSFQFVANQWRRYLLSISDGGVPCTGNCDTDVQDFTVSTVNIEENGAKENGNIPYVVPPGITRLRDNSSTLTNRRQNEQSLQLCVDGLKDSFGKAVYKNVSMDMLIYKRLKMYIHAESPQETTQDNEMKAFIRIGTDYNQNYYEYSIPLKLTRSGALTPGEIWPSENLVDVAFQDFVNTKAERNQLTGINIFQPYTKNFADGRSITVVGNPDFSSVQGIMVGILNPRSADRAEKSMCIWINELRVSDFDKTAGWATNAQFNAKIADLGTVSATGSYTTVGFGGLQQKIATRARENTSQIDINTNIAADKFLPPRLGIKIPVSVQYGNITQEPRFDPLDPDTPLEQSLAKFDNREERNAYRKEVITQVTTKSINLLNVRKEKVNPEAKPRPYDLENLSFSYAYTERLRTDIVTDRDLTKSYTGGVAYTYNATPKNYTPLAQLKPLQSPYLKFLQELNITPLPSRVAIRADLDRRYNEIFLQRRLGFNDMPTTQGIEPTFQKYFFFNRIYDLKWDLTKSLTFDYTATNRAVVDEPDGQIDRNSEDPDIRRRNEIIWKNLQRFGRTTNFDQMAAITYRLPLDKFPLTDWISADARYAAGYTWTSGSTAIISDTLQLGNTIQNNTETSVTGKVDLIRLYNKVRFLKAINDAPPKAPATAQPAQTPAAPVAQADTAAKKPELKALKAVLRSLMTARSLNFTYALTEGILLPGYLPRTKAFGLDEGFDAPGLPFVLGKQYELESLYRMAENKGWYTDSSHLLNTPLSALSTQNFSVRTALEPFRNFNIQLDAKQDRSEIEEVFYRLTTNDFGKPLSTTADRQNPIHTGSFSSSTVAIGTLFETGRDGASAAFENFIRYRGTILNSLTGIDQGRGKYTANSQDVLMPAFLYAYQGRDIGGYEAKPSRPFGVFPLPNWRIDYNGLTDLPVMQKYFSSVTLSHVYNASYNITNFSTSLEYTNEPGRNELPTQVNEQGEYVPYYVISQVLISERMAPLVGVNFRTKNNISGRVELRTERNLALNMTNAQVTQNGIKDYVIGMGYTTTNFRIPFKIKGEFKTLKNELNARLDLTLRDNETIQRTIVMDDSGVEKSRNVVTNGTLQMQLRPTIDYTLNQRLNIQFYFTRVISDPKVANAFRNTVTEGGIQLRYSLSE